MRPQERHYCYNIIHIHVFVITYRPPYSCYMMSYTPDNSAMVVTNNYGVDVLCIMSKCILLFFTENDLS